MAQLVLSALVAAIVGSGCAYYVTIKINNLRAGRDLNQSSGDRNQAGRDVVHGAQAGRDVVKDHGQTGGTRVGGVRNVTTGERSPISGRDTNQNG